jgi:hypothetical protein
VQNDGNEPDSFIVTGPGSTTQFIVRYFVGTVDVASSITGAGLLLADVAPGETRSLRLSVTVRPAAARGFTQSWLVMSKSHSDSSQVDAVKAVVTVP